MPPTGKDWPISARAGLENSGDWLDKGLRRWHCGIVDEVGGWMAGLGKVWNQVEGKEKILYWVIIVGLKRNVTKFPTGVNYHKHQDHYPNPSCLFRSLFINDLFCYTSPCSFFFLLASFKNILVSLKKFLAQPHVPLQLFPYVSLTIHSQTSRELLTLTVSPSAFTPLLNCSDHSRKMTSINITRITSLPKLIA